MIKDIELTRFAGDSQRPGLTVPRRSTGESQRVSRYGLLPSASLLVSFLTFAPTGSEATSERRVRDLQPFADLRHTSERPLSRDVSAES